MKPQLESDLWEVCKKYQKISKHLVNKIIGHCGTMLIFLTKVTISNKSLQAINAGEGVEKRESSYTVGGNANYYSHYGEQCGDTLKNWK